MKAQEIDKKDQQIYDLMFISKKEFCDRYDISYPVLGVYKSPTTDKSKHGISEQAINNINLKILKYAFELDNLVYNRIKECTQSNM